jgi:hypothetical protein
MIRNVLFLSSVSYMPALCVYLFHDMPHRQRDIFEVWFFETFFFGLRCRLCQRCCCLFVPFKSCVNVFYLVFVQKAKVCEYVHAVCAHPCVCACVGFEFVEV